MRDKENSEMHSNTSEKLIYDLSLDQTFDCGQCFRWEKESDGSWTGIAMGKVVNLSEEKVGESGAVKLSGYQDWLYEYLDLATDYGSIKTELAKRDETIRKAIEYGQGIRILKQDFWETLVSFIISQNNNIPRIKGCIDKLASLMGERVSEYDGPNGEHIGKVYYELPTPEKLASSTVEDLASVRLGYRAPYLIAAARQYLENPDRALIDFMGVGPKVANCISLFGKHELDAFPIDVWVKRVMNRLYGFKESDVKGMANFAQEKFSPYGGIAQQYLFYYIREIKEFE